MASRTIKKDYSGRSQYELILAVSTNSTDTANNRSRYNYRLYARSKSGHGSFVYDNGTAWMELEGGRVTDNSAPPLTFGPSGDYTGKEITLISGVSNWRTHNSNGDLSVTIDGYSNSGGVIGSASLTQTSFAADRIPEAPGKPGTPTFSNITPTGAKASWSAGSRGHASIDNYDIDWSTNSNFSGLIDGNPGNNRTFDMTSLAPGTKYYVRTRAHNGDGWGPYSSTGSFTTLPSSPPSIVVVPTPAGSGANVTLAPPGGVSSVDSYEIVADGTNSGDPNIHTWTKSGGTTTFLATGLVPGVTYEWTVRATIGTYTSPWSDPFLALQPAPNTAPGNYFDGSTADKDDLTYDWTGTAYASTSEASGLLVTGWAVDDSDSGGDAVMHQVTGGLIDTSGEKAARVVMITPASSDGLFAGTNDSDPGAIAVNEIASYYASIYVQISRVQPMAAAIRWYTSGGSFISQTFGDTEVVPSNEVERLLVSGASPSGAAWAQLGVVDVDNGTDWTPWQSGDQILLDAAAMSLSAFYPYFDGNTEDTATSEYEWVGAENASPSFRTDDLTAGAVDPLEDPDCPVPPGPPRPPLVPLDCTEEEDQWRRYWFTIDGDDVPAWLVAVPTFTIKTGSEPLTAVRGRIYENPDGLSADEVDTSEWVGEIIVSYIPPNTVFTVDGVRRRAYASVDGGPTRSADHLLYGTAGRPAEWTELSCGYSYLVSVDVPLSESLVNVDGEPPFSAELTRRY